ncbi:MAG: hypothetical protein SF182_00185 [Deltaproteobacteria bacterium]|nr:hypothetical protein [Deltaproteobacteria bacterium]
MSTRPRRRRLSRRQFIASSALTGVALGLPGVLSGCGDDDGDGPRAATPTPTAQPTATPLPQGPREDRTLQFDLSFAQVEEARLCILNSSDDGLRLEPHTAESRAHFRAEDPLLRGVADERLTHYAVDVDLPSDALQHFWIMGQHGDRNEAALLGLQLHVPEVVQRTLAAQKRASGQRRVYSAKVHAYGLQRIADELDLEDLEPALDEFVSPWDTAAALVFHHPEIMNLDPEQGTAIRDLIQTLPCPEGDATCQPFLSTLAFRIAQHWPATESGLTVVGGVEVPAWAKLVKLIDPDSDQPLVDTEGNPVYHTNLADETIAAAQQTIRAVLKSIFNDPRFEGNNWHALTGRTEERGARSFSFGSVAAEGYKLVAEHPPGTNAHGLDFVALRVANEMKRTVEVQVRNWHLRTHSVHVQFADENGPLPVADRGAADTERAKHIGMVITANTIMGVPVPFDVQTYSFDMPADATRATVFFGSLGMGGEAFCPEALNGSIFTLVFNFAIPVVALAAGVSVGASLVSSLSKESVANIAALIGRWVTSILVTSSSAFARGIFGSKSSGSLLDFLRSLLDLVANLVTQLVLPILAIVANKLLGVATSAANVLFFGPQILSNAATLAELVQSLAEVLISPALFTNRLTFQMTTTVRIEKDPDNFQFPARARHYAVTLIYDEASAVSYKQEGDIAQGRVEPIEVVFEQVPSGGKVSLEVVLTTDEGYIVGLGVDANGKEGPIGPIDNTPQNAGVVTVPIKERLIPLTQQTRYQHELELKYENGHRVWVAGAAPTATRAVLCQGQDDRLCTLGGLTVNQRTGMVGYSFSAGGQGDRPYCGESSGGVMHLVQNVFLGDDPERALKLLPCGFRHPAGIVYDRLAASNGRHFFMEPDIDGASYFLQSVLLDETTPFGLGNALSWGRFTEALESLAVVPSGYVVGVSRLSHKMEILKLPSRAVDRGSAPEAIPFAVQKGGEGTREGLLNAPVAVAVFDTTVLVLETGNARIQAFDVSGNPVRAFKNGTSATIELEQTDGVEYLDLAVEGLGYMYVLSAANNGLTVEDYRLDLFTPQGNRLARTTGVAAARLAVDTFRNLYTLNFATLAGAPRVEPSLSQWVPSTPAA